MIAITFQKREEVSLQETYPAMFSIPAQNIAVMKQGFDLQRTDSGTYLLTIPLGDYAQEAKEGDMIVFNFNNDISGSGAVITFGTDVPARFVDVGHYEMVVELSAEGAKIFLSNFGQGIECKIIDNSFPTCKDIIDSL